MKRLLLLLLVVLLATAFGGWKWNGTGHRTAGWTWDNNRSAYVWDDPTPGFFADDNAPS